MKKRKNTKEQLNNTNIDDEISEEKLLKKRKRRKKRIIFLIIVTIILISIEQISAYKFRSLVKEMRNLQNSTIIDANGNELGKVGESKNKINEETFPQDLKNAYIAIEDKRYYKHGGIDLKRTLAATTTYIIHNGKSSYGGSSITQQLVKNLTGEADSSVKRKIVEGIRSIQLSNSMSKDEILNLYLNIIYTAPNCYGVGAGSKYYFDKSPSDLTIAECSFLAGINHSPNSYDIITDSSKIEKAKARTTIVLDEMKSQKYINDDQYNQAMDEVNAGFYLKNGDLNNKSKGIFSYHTDAAINEAAKDLQQKYHISNSFAENYLEYSGSTIKSNQDKDIQNIIESESKKSKYVIKSGNDHAECALVLIEPGTGKVLGCIGGIGEKTQARPLNRATQSIRQVGSSIKPVGVVAPAIAKKQVNTASILDDSVRSFGDDNYTPTDVNKPLGKITLRRAIESSQNIPFVQIMETLTPKESIKYLKKMGITTLTNRDDNLNLALGGLDKGISPLEFAGCYNTLANGGVYIEPTFYSTIQNKEGKTILTNTPKKRRVFSEDVAFIMKELLKQPVEGTYGTATYCKIGGIDVAAKTGTTDNKYDKWLCGFTPYYTCVSWFGFDQSKELKVGSQNPAGLLWANVMTKVHKDEPNKKFEMPEDGNVVKLSICSSSHRRARTLCPKTYEDYFLKGCTPDLCEVHSGNARESIILNNDTAISSENMIEDIKKEIKDKAKEIIDADEKNQ